MIIATGTALERAGMDIGDWLRSLGLEKYEAVFRDNEIEVDVLPELTNPARAFSVR
jgi:hypothetical protein